MRKKLLPLLYVLFIACNVNAQDQPAPKTNKLTPFIEVQYNLGLCGESNPLSFTAGLQKSLTRKLTLSYDINYWNTSYENYCCNVYSKGKYIAVIPSVKLTWNAGKRKDRGFFAGVGLGYIFAKDRGTEQSYSTTPGTNEMVFTKSAVAGNWDFNSIAPSFSWGVGLKVFRLPVSFVNTNYFAKSTLGWGPVSTSAGIRIGFRKN
jgi:hypothetical protein